VEQFFELEDTPIQQRARLLLLSMEGKAFACQCHYIKTFDFQHQSWTQILKDVTQRFDDGVFDDLVAELSQLKQGSSLVDYLEKFDNLLVIVMVSDEMTLCFFLVRFNGKIGEISSFTYTNYTSRSCAISPSLRGCIAGIDKGNSWGFNGKFKGATQEF